MKKKVTSIVLLCAISIVFPLSISASQRLPKEIQSSKIVCENCGKAQWNTVKLGEYEKGPTEQKCIHGYPYGDDLVEECYTVYQHECSECSYKGDSWSEKSGNSIECHGYY